jgi:hypothetical protein
VPGRKPLISKRKSDGSRGIDPIGWIVENATGSGRARERGAAAPEIQRFIPENGRFVLMGGMETENRLRFETLNPVIDRKGFESSSLEAGTVLTS